VQISFSQKFIFIHVQRTAGGSLINALRPYEHRAPVTRWNKQISRAGLRRDPEKISFRTHATALDVRQLLPAGMYEEFFSFAFVRNPYSWLVSEFEVVRQNSDHRHYKHLVKMKGFGEYVDWEVRRAKRYQYPLVTDEEGQVMVDFLGHFERLREDYDKVCERLSLPSLDTLPHKHKRTPRDYRDYYDDEIRAKVAKFWKKDIALFGYDFDGLVGTQSEQ
jgi:hypothetical protein